MNKEVRHPIALIQIPEALNFKSPNHMPVAQVYEGTIWGFYRDNGKQAGNYYLLFRVYS